MRRACIDIGSNTTRLLVAECDGEQLLEVHQERVFTHLGRGLQHDAELAPAKIERVAEVVAAQLQSARELGCVAIHGVGTAAIRRAVNRDELVEAIRHKCGLNVEILSEQEEARLAFVGAAGTLGYVPEGPIGVVDVGGGSSELIVGTAPSKVSWSASFAVGSGDLAADFLHSDPPSVNEICSARERVENVLDGLRPPPAAEAVAVGGSAASLRRLAGSLLDADGFARCLAVLCGERSVDVARRFALDIDRVRLLPAGLLILEGASRVFHAPLQVGRGGLREGVLLDA